MLNFRGSASLNTEEEMCRIEELIKESSRILKRDNKDIYDDSKLFIAEAVYLAYNKDTDSFDFRNDKDNLEDLGEYGGYFGLFICAIYNIEERLIRFNIKVFNSNSLAYSTNKSYDVLNCLYNNINAEEGDNELEKYKSYIKGIFIKFIKNKFYSIDIIDYNSVSLFSISSKESFYDIMYYILCKRADSYSVVTSIVQNFKCISSSTNERVPDNIIDILNKYGRTLIWLNRYFLYLTDNEETWYIDNKFSIEKDYHIGIPEEDKVILSEVKEKVLEPLETMTIKTNNTKLFNSVFIINSNNIWDELLVEIIDTIRKNLCIPIHSIINFSTSVSETMGFQLFIKFIKENYGGIAVFKYEDTFADICNDGMSLFSYGSKLSKYEIINDLISSPDLIPIIITESPKVLADYIENNNSNISVNVINGVEYVSPYRIINYIYEFIIDYNLEKYIDKKDIQDMIDIDMNKNYEFDDKLLFLEQAKMEVYKKIFPKLKFTRSNKVTFSGLEKLNSLVGLDYIKKEIQKIVSFWTIEKYKADRIIYCRDNSDSYKRSESLSMVFTGNPGTCKTTVAKILAEGLYKAGVISSSKFAFVTRGDIVGRYVGHTAANVKDIFDNYKCGTIFIDEAYSLSEGEYGNNNFGKEAINELVAQMDENRNTLVILAGYPDEMEKFISCNPGLKSRIGFYINFKDYTIDELMDILNLLAKDANVDISKDAIETVKIIINQYIGTKNFGNGRFMRKILYEARLNQSIRLMKKYDNLVNKIPITELNTLYKEDFINIDPYNIIEGSVTNEEIRNQIL